MIGGALSLIKRLSRSLSRSELEDALRIGRQFVVRQLRQVDPPGRVCVVSGFHLARDVASGKDDNDIVPFDFPVEVSPDNFGLVECFGDFDLQTGFLEHLPGRGFFKPLTDLDDPAWKAPDRSKWRTGTTNKERTVARPEGDADGEERSFGIKAGVVGHWIRNCSSASEKTETHVRPIFFIIDDPAYRERGIEKCVGDMP